MVEDIDATQRLEIIAYLGTELNHVKDVDVLMEKLLGEARHLANADAGSLYTRDGNVLKFSYCQNETLEKRLAPGAKLVYKSFTLPIDQKTMAGYAAQTGRSLNVPDVYELPPDAPYDFGVAFDEAANYRTRSALTIPLKTARDEVVGVLQVINARDARGVVVPFPKDDEQALLHFADLSAVALERAQMTRSMILRMIRMAELRDPKETGAHVIRVGAIATELYDRWAKAHQVPQPEAERRRDVLRSAAMLHDVGKVGIPDAILKKPGKFTPEEFEVMKEHCVLGARLFEERKSDFDEGAFDVVFSHHERWDGGGYPGHVDVLTGKALPGFEADGGRARGKRGDEIPLFGRIVAVADVYDALLSKRVYKEAWSEEDTFKVLREGAGKQFDPELIEIFFASIEAFRSIRKIYAE